MLGFLPHRKMKKAEGVRVRPEYTPLDLFRREFASLFDRAFPTFPFEPAWELEPPPFEIEEKENEVVVKALVPGFDPKEIEILLRGNELTVKAEHKEPVQEKEFVPPYAKFERFVTLPVGIFPEKVEAVCRNGVLEIHIPLLPEAKPVRIEVKV